MTQYMFENPFVECTARDMEYSEVVKYWCSPFSYYQGLDQTTLFNSRTPILIEGARGSGKTMILKYLSYFCQREESLRQEDKDLIAHFKRIGGVGFYYRFKKDFGNLLSLLNCDDTLKKSLFVFYFQLYYSREIVMSLNDLQLLESLNDAESKGLLEDFNKLFEASCSNFDDSISYINKKINELDHILRKSRYLSDVQNIVGDLAINENCINIICKSIEQHVAGFKGIKFLILIDEYENIAGFQHIVNTYLKQV